MKIILAGVLGFVVIVALFIPKLKNYRSCILIGYGVGALLLSAFQTFRTASLTLPFYHAKEQMFFQSDFAREGLYPDAFLQLLVKDRTVYTKDDLDEYLDSHVLDVDNYDDGKYWMYQYYHQFNTTEFLEAAGANVISDDVYNDAIISQEQFKDFEDIGYANDMYRYLFPLSNLNDEWSNSFFYYWYYGPYLHEKKAYLNPDGIEIEGGNDLVILWEEDETLYIMSKEYYDREVAVNE